MVRAVLTFALLLSAGVARADSGRWRGLTALSALNERFPCERLIEALRDVDRPAIQVLWGTFGTSPKCVTEFTLGHKQSAVEIHLSNESCRRFSRCGHGELVGSLSVARWNRALRFMRPATERAIVRRLERIGRFVDALPSNVTPILSAGLEDNYSRPAYDQLLKVIRAHWSYEVVRSVTSRVSYIGSADFVELHTTDPGHDVRAIMPCIVSSDGVSPGSSLFPWPRAREFVQSSPCEATFLYLCSLHGRCGGRFTNPETRHFSFPRDEVVRVKQVLH